MDTRVIVYDSDMKKVAILENAFNIGYSKKLNELWTASFSLPADDPKNEYCQPLAYVEIFDQGERVDLFRITPITLDKSDLETNTYQCEHVLATLIDDVMFQYHEIGGVGVYTDTIINYVLNKQTETRWVLGQNDFKRQFLYKWENENLLGSLFSIPKPFLEDYQWTWDTTVFPWVLNLVEINQEVQSYVRYKKNLKAITREIDPTELCTRLYCLGYGEGINQLTIADVNNGVPYLDAATINQFGVVSRIFVDRRYEDAESLKSAGQAILNELQVPRITYEVDAADISSITNDPVDKFVVGTYTRVIDTDLDINVKALIINVTKSDLTGNPGAVTIQIANKPRDIASSIAELADRQRINEVYAQGATNLDSYSFLDNCDPNYPAILRFYIPQETVRINKMILSYQAEAFRSYSKAIEGGGAYADTTEDGGGTSTSSENGGAATTTSEDGGADITTSKTSSYWDLFTINVQDAISPFRDHNHGIPHGTVLQDRDGNQFAFSESGGHGHNLQADHRHEVDIPNHKHRVDIPNHKHGVNIPNHKHAISLPDHTHEIEYGIFEGPTPTELTVEIDGNIIPGVSDQEDDINIIPYLSKDGGGRIIRGWHEIKITPNDLGRISANVSSQIFVQSRGGGNY